MTAITYDGATPTIGSDQDTWGQELNVGALAKIKADLDMLNTSTTGAILGRVTAGTGEVERLTPTQAATTIDPVVGDSGSGGLKGLVPAPASGDAAARKFLMASGAWVADERKGWAVITGSTGAVVSGRNIACVRSTAGRYAITFSTALANADYAVFATLQDAAIDNFVAVLATGKTAAGFTVAVQTAGAAAFDPAQLYLTVIG